MIMELFNKKENSEVIYLLREKHHLFWNEEALLNFNTI